MDDIFKVKVNNNISGEKQNISSERVGKPQIHRQPTEDTLEKETERTSSENIRTDRFSTGNENLVFKTVKIQFFPEDKEKMEKMNIKDRIAYKIKLKEEGKYKVINPDETDT